MSTRVTSNDPVTFRALIPKAMNINGLFAPIRDACIKDAKAMGKDFEKVIRTWKGDKPRIQTEAQVVYSNTPPYAIKHDGFSASAWPRNDNSKGYWKWVWLDKGTKVRYAHMTKGFIPKTRGGQLRSWVGKGGLAYINKKRPLPGIKARKFTLALRKKWEAPFKAHIKKAVEKGALASGHSAR